MIEAMDFTNLTPIIIGYMANRECRTNIHSNINKEFTPNEIEKTIAPLLTPSN